MPEERPGDERQRALSERSYRELYEEAKSRGIAGRSTMNKGELKRHLAE